MLITEAVLVLISWLFYRSILPVILLSVALIPVFREEKIRRQRKREEKLGREFCDGMRAFAAAMEAGMAPENAAAGARDELIRIYKGTSILAEEFSELLRSLSIGRSFEECLSDIALRTGITDIQSMAEVVSIARRTGGSLPVIVKDTVRTMEEKAALKDRIITMMAAKRAEYRIMCAMPAGILLYLNLTSADYVAPLYEGIAARVVMTVLLIIYAVTAAAGERMVRIRV